MRQMPAGQWVAFEGHSPHDCDRSPPQRVTTFPPRTPTPPAIPEFEDIDIPLGTGPAESPVGQPVLNPVPVPVTPIGSASKRPPPNVEKPPTFDDFDIAPAPAAVATPTGTPVRDNQPTRRERVRQPASGDSVAIAKPTGADGTGPSPQPMRPAVRSSESETGGRKVLLAALYLLVCLYFAIGTLHSVYFSLFISRTDCIDPKNIIVNAFCNTGMGTSHFVTLLGWPLYYR